MHLTGERFDRFVWLPAADESVTVVYSHACNLVLISPRATQFGPMLARAEIESPRSKMMWNLAICFGCWEIWHPILSETQIVTALVNMQYLMKRGSIVQSWRPSWSPLKFSWETLLYPSETHALQVPLRELDVRSWMGGKVYSDPMAEPKRSIPMVTRAPNFARTIPTTNIYKLDQE